MAFVNDYGKLPIHTAQDTIDLMSPDELALNAQIIAAVVDHLSSQVELASSQFILASQFNK